LDLELVSYCTECSALLCFALLRTGIIIPSFLPSSAAHSTALCLCFAIPRLWVGSLREKEEAEEEVQNGTEKRGRKWEEERERERRKLTEPLPGCLTAACTRDSESCAVRADSLHRCSALGRERKGRSLNDRGDAPDKWIKSGRRSNKKKEREGSTLELS
jgi:hypothetical protein